VPKEVTKSFDSSFARELIAWQLAQGRHDLPWQHDRTAYRVWLSEIMLQQTQVSTVIERYQAFLRRFPTIFELANAHVDDVLAEWSGLGYYTRARNLHLCAQRVVHEYQGVFPDAVDELEKLPGIGRSTAAAIVVFAYGKKAAILDGNVKRVLARIWGIEDDLTKTSHLKSVWSLAESLLPDDENGVVPYTQGLMDFGATACTPATPICITEAAICPFMRRCKAFKQGRVLDLPLKARSIKVEHLNMDWLVVFERNRFVLEKRINRGIWEGLWCFPETLPFKWVEEERYSPIKHVLTHRRMSIRPIRVKPKTTSLKLSDDFRWVSTEEALALGLPKPVKDFLQQLSRVRDVA
jgi:A/G-specific adenine glycosylase